MGHYEISLKDISLDQFETILRTKRILPGRVILLEQLTERFQILKSDNVNNVEDLISLLKSPQKIKFYAEKSDIPADYLTILKREASSYSTKPVKLKNIIPGDPIVLKALEQEGIQNSKQFYLKCFSSDQRISLSDKLNIETDIINYILKLCDLLRINGVGPMFAQFLYDVGIDSVKSVLSISQEEILDMFNEYIQTTDFPDVNLSINDIRHCKEMGKFLPPGPKI